MEAYLRRRHRNPAGRGGAAAFAVVLAQVSLAPAAFAQGGGVRTEITGFEDWTWGQTEAAITDSLGAPVERQVLEHGAFVLVYQSLQQGFDAVTLFLLHEESGLMKGRHAVSPREGVECEDQFERLRSTVNLTYPLIRPVDQRYNNSRAGFCEAWLEGTAGRLTQWTDPKNGSTASVILSSGRTDILVVYESAAFKEWAGAGAEANSATAANPPEKTEASPNTPQQDQP